MTFRVTEDDDRRLVRVTLEGTYDKAEIVAMVGEARKASAARKWPILYDLRGARPGAMGAADVFWMPRQHPALRAPDASMTRVAVVYPSEKGDLASFWENTFRNAGLRARAFTQEDAALEWLEGKEAH